MRLTPLRRLRPHASSSCQGLDERSGIGGPRGVDLEPGCRVKTSFRECQNARVSRTRTLRALLIATTVAGVSLPHLVVGEAAGSVPGLIVGIVVGLGCLRLGLLTRSSGARVLSAFAIATVALAPLSAYLAQEAAERESGIEAAQVEPSLLAAILVRRIVVIGAIVVALGFAALDLLEVSHQVRKGTTLVAIIAGLVAVGHLLAAGFGAAIVRRPTTI